MSVRLLLFGSPTVESDGESFALPFERRNQLLAFLALKRSWVGRGELAALLWPDQETKLAYTNLRKTLFRVQSLPWTSRIESQGGSLRFEADTDVLAFDSALREHRIDEALRLHRGELLAGFDDASEAWSSWLNFERDRLRLAWRDAALERLSADIDAGEAIDLSARLLEADPLDEAALRAHLTWLARGGQTARARQLYREFADRLDRELGLTPGTELRALHDSLGASARPTAPSAAASAMPDDDFVGRTVELRRIAALLARADCSLVCLIGPGGAGKTRLAQRAMRELSPRYADGATFVAFEDIASPSDFGGRLARELGVPLVGGAEPLDQVIAFLGEQQRLLVLDNFEQLAADASILDRLLHGCARLKIIVTSRVRLATSKEWLVPVEGLPYPEIEDRDRLEAFDAVRLFVKAAQRVEPALVAAVEAASILDICRQVDGLPLALELAAAWTRVLSCEAIAVELRQGTELLHAVDAAQPTRHASMDVVFEQSWRLLTPVERDALSRLSVFRGGFSADAARAVAAASLPVLGALADKSLVRKHDARISMHPLVQQLAGLRLDGEPRERTERSHAEYFHRMLAQLRCSADDGDREGLLRIETEFENCRIAWRWSLEHEAAQALWRSAPTLLNFCDHRNRPEEGLSLLREGLEARVVERYPKLGAMLLAAAAHLEYRLDRYADAEKAAGRALEASEVTDDHETKLQCLKVLGSCCLRLGRHDEAKRYFRQALDLAPASVNPHNAAAMLDNLALVEKSTGRYGDAARLSIQSLTELRRLGDVAGEALCLNNLGALYLDQGAYESATAYLREGLAVAERHGLVSTHSLILANLAEIAVKTGDDAAAENHGRRALEVAEGAGNRGVACWLKLLFVRLALRRGDFPAARSELAAALGIAVAVARPSLKLAGVCCFAELLEAQGAPDVARRVLEFAAGHPSTSGAQLAEIRTRLAQLAPSAATEPARSRLELDELVQRIIVESSVAHAPLIASLKS